MESGKLIKLIFDETGIPVESYRVILDGWDNKVIEVNNEIIFRFTRRAETQTQHIKELALLPFLNQTLTLQVPNPTHWRISGESPYYMAYKRINGDPLTREAAQRLDTDYLVESFADLLGQLQDTPISLFRAVPLYKGEEWRNQYVSLYNRVMKEIAPRLEADTVEAIKTVFDEPLNKQDYFDFIPALIHRDLTSDHILYKDQQLTGVIDWGDACFGDPAFDLAGFIMDYDEGLVKQLTDTLEVPAHCLDRSRFYALVSPFYGYLHGLDIGDNKMLTDGLLKIKKILT